EAFQSLESTMQGLQPCLVFGGKVFRFALRIVSDLVGEIKATVAGQLAEDPEFTFAGVERGAHVLRGKLRGIEPGPAESNRGQSIKPFVRQFTGVLAAQPGALGQIKDGILAIELPQLK